MMMSPEQAAVRVRLIEEEWLKAIFTLDCGDLVVRGFRILASRYPNADGEHLELLPPTYEDESGRHHPVVFIPDKDLWRRLETRMIAEYRRAQAEAAQATEAKLPLEGNVETP